MDLSTEHAPRKRKVWPIALAVVGAVILLACCGVFTTALVAGGEDPKAPIAAPGISSGPASPVTSAPPVTSSTKAPSPSTPVRVLTVEGTGTFRVPGDMTPGTWKSEPVDPGSVVGCSWERLRDFSGTYKGIIAADYTHGQSIVTVLPSDEAFKSSGCRQWVRIGD
jgi:hypothetical protein